MRTNYFGLPFLIGLALFSIMLALNYSLAYNVTPSIPGKLFLIKKHQPLTRGVIVAAIPSKTAKAPEGVRHLKIIRGLPGDLVEHVENKVFINGELIGHTKSHALTGRKLQKGKSGRISPNEYFLWTPHVDSYDSRYLEVGNYKREQIIGVATPITFRGLM